MINLSAALDNLIAMVLVLLALSLVVQAAQGAFKKAFKLKSRQIEDSLAHLFQFVLYDATNAQAERPETNNVAQAGGDSATKTLQIWANKWKGFNAVIAQSPFLRVFLRFVYHPAADERYEEAANLFNEVINRFRAMGRTALSTRPIFDSIEKDDLLNVLSSIAPGKIDRDFSKKLTAIAVDFNSLVAQFQTWQEVLSGFDPQNTAGYFDEGDRAKLAQMQASLKPLFDDLRLLLTGRTSTGITMENLIGDVKKLRALNWDDSQKLIMDVRDRVAQALEKASIDKDANAIKDLTLVDSTLRKFADTVVAFREKFNAIFMNWTKLENYFDTVMQSFEERYNRSMKTTVIIISFLVAVFLNANFFSVFQNISTSDAKRNLIIQSREDVMRALRSDNPQQTEQNVETWFRASKAEIEKNASIFEGYGFSPITWHQTREWFATLTVSGGDQWWTYRKHDLKVLLGWVVMALLLSVGAPFWQDFLESLFGVKNVLRKQSETQNVEQKAGAGQTKLA